MERRNKIRNLGEGMVKLKKKVNDNRRQRIVQKTMNKIMTEEGQTVHTGEVFAVALRN